MRKEVEEYPMTVPDYYSLLSLSQQESMAAIAAAHRDFLRNIDHIFGSFWPPGRIRAFERAFSVLGRESARNAYDEELEMQPRLVSSPLEREMPTVPSILGRPESVHPSFEGLYERIARNFTGVGVPKGEHTEALTVAIAVTPDDIEEQRAVSVGIPTFDLCPTCSGSGRVELFGCPACEGQGTVERMRVVEHVLGRERVIEYSLDEFGIRNCFLRLEIQVAQV
ncbi:MAG TPA: hypothetical protein VE621_04120 [Bryobacteraceae bacterium]|nr:hypothetical protein [Bryobacteraceae bacterium]